MRTEFELADLTIACSWLTQNMVLPEEILEEILGMNP